MFHRNVKEKLFQEYNNFMPVDRSRGLGNQITQEKFPLFPLSSFNISGILWKENLRLDIDIAEKKMLQMYIARPTRIRQIQEFRHALIQMKQQHHIISLSWAFKKQTY